MSDELARRNMESWRELLDSYEKIAPIFELEPERLSPIIGVVRALYASDFAKRFRAGKTFKTFRGVKSSEAFIISTAPKHRLENDEPFVVVTLNRDSQFLLIEYRDRVIDGRTLGRYMCSERECMSYLHPVLSRLWEDTRGRRAT
jgi:hypothetical protein